MKKVATADGKAIDPVRNYSIVVTEGSVPETYLQNCEKTEFFAYDVITKAIQSAGTISPPKDGRMKIQTN